MSAVFTGNGLGLFNTSLSQLGYGGGAGVGQGRDAQYVNVATGNLVWQGSDEHLVFRGLSVNLGRTYNSLGQLVDSGADGWITGFERRLVLQSGALNAAGSVMRRYTGDGAYQDFTYVAANTYQATGGDGAHDTLTWSGTEWRYVEGSTRREEGYASHADGVQQGRLTYLRELRSDGSTPTTWLVDYDANQRIQQVRSQDGTSSGDALVFGYDGAGRLSAVATRENGVLKSQVWYEYDGQGRLAGVVTDLTPDVVTSVEDPRTGANQWNATASANNGQLFRTQYSYEGTSLHLASVTQSDGTLVSFTYHADGRLKTITRGDSNINDADGVGQTLTYTYGTGTTTVADSLGRSWVYAFDGAGQLTSLTAPAISGQSDVTSYQYDAAGNVTQVRTVRGASVLSQVDYAYDAAGNVTWEWDAAGNAISRTWSATNQLLSVTQYTGVDPDRTGASLPTGGLTTRYIYDVQDRLRFVIDALGQVSEFGYATSGNGIGQQDSLRQYLGASYSGTYDLTSLQAWATATQKTTSTLSELSYDAWGRLSQRADYATVNASGVGVLDAATAISRYTYDAQGLLRQQSTVRGASRTLTGIALAGSQQVVHAYDGMGRLMSTTARQVGSTDTDVSTIHTSYAYLDSGQQIVTTTDTGMTRTQTRNAAGQLLSVSEVGNAGSGTQTRTQLNYYDSAGQLRATEDAAGGRTYFFYDAKGRLEATVDATGAVSRTFYDGADRVVGTRQYANRLTTTSWLVSGQVVPTQLDSLGIVSNTTTDRVTETTYDTAGRIATVTDGIASSAARSISTYTYDGADRLLQVRTTDSVNTAATARVVRHFYDDAGRRIGTLDAAGYLSEVQYDRAGRVQMQTRYATVSPSAQWANGTLAQLRPATDALNDQTTRHYYDGRGNLIGTLDAQGYLTEWILDEAGNARAERRYGTAVTWASNDTLASLRSRAGAYREQRMAYNALGQVETQTNAEGTVTRYTYDEAGRLVKTEVAQGTSEVREGHLRYNAFNELIGELSGEGALQVLPGMSEAQLDAVYAQHGVRHGYDVLGRRIESIDAAGNRSWYFHDAAGRPSFTVRGVADSGNVANAQGEVTETRYNAFGQASETITYTGRITLATPGSRASAQAAISVLSYVAASDTRRQYTYTTRGQLASLIDAEASTTQYSYDAFGQLREQIAAVGTAVSQTTQYRYDARGLQTRVIEGVGTALERERTATYDAFGRLSTTTDARGSVRSLSYDRLGRQLTLSQAVSGRMEATATAYDAYSRVVSQTDALGRVTMYAHDDAARSLTVTSPEGVVVSTLHNRHGQTVRVTDVVGYSEYTYNRSGQLTLTQRKASDGTLITSQSDEYDVARGLLTATVDGSGRRVEFTYDAAGRVLRRIEDPAGTPRITQYQYDGQGRQLAVTDPSGRVVQYAYDREGRLKEVVQDPAGVNVQTRYAYDAAGQQISLIEGGGSAARVTSYTYDVLGRRISEVVDPGAGKLNLTTAYAYDTNDNVIRRTDANGAVSRYYYDEANRQIYHIDPLGAMTRTWYDAAGRVVATRQFVQLTNAATLTDSLTIAQVDARLSWGATDQSHYRVYDRDGRLRYAGNLLGQIAEYYYDAAGRQIGTRAFATLFVPDATLEQELLQGTLHAGDLDASYLRDDARDHRKYQVLDAAGQVRLLVDGLGNVRQMQYDAAGRLVGSIAHAQPAALSAGLRTQLEAGTATVAGVLATLTADPARDQVQYRVHDAAGRLRYTIDALGAVRESLFDAAGNVVGERAYATPITVDATLRGKLQAGTATVADIGGLLAAGWNDARNVEQFQIRDAAGRVRFTVAVLRDAAGTGTGLITEFKYDTVGRLVERIERETPISAATLEMQLPALRAGTASITTLAGFMTAALRTTAFIYDAAGRVRYTLQAVDAASTWAVREQRYDAVGQVVAEVAYAVTISNGTTRTEVAVAAAITAAGGDAPIQHRVTRSVWSATGQLRFRMDDAGAVTELRYDGLGRVVESRQYAQLVSTGTAATETAMAAAVAGQSGANVRITQTAYNAAGQVVSVTDAAGKTESYVYDGLGLRIQLTNKLGHVWTYAYDAAGRMVEETSPSVTVATASITGTVSTSARTIKTVITYDALGNVLSRTEDATGTQPRTTQYQYDNRGHQIKTIFPDAWQIGTASGAFEATGNAPTIEVTYDALGRAVVQKDVRGYYSYKVYDTLGRIAHEVDADGYVTAYGYNAFGEQTTLRRHATKLNTAAIAGFTAGSALSLSQMTGSAVVADAANDRVLTTTYDRRGLKTQVTQSAITYVRTTGATASASPTTQFSYNAFGELTKTSVLLDQAGGLWAHSWQYYDELGRATLSVDAEGYVTTTQYNALGEVTLVHEHARALTAAAQAALTTTAPPAPPAGGDAAIGYDRLVSYTYDAMGRKASETALRHYGRADGSQGVRNVSTQWTYDAAGQVVITDLDGQQTRTSYDVLGRVSAVQEAAQQRLANTAESQLLGTTNIGLGTQGLYVQVSAYTAMAYDAFGNAVQVTRYANGLQSGQSAPVADAANDQVSVTLYDRQGRAVMSRDAQGQRVFLQYDAADHVVHSWYALSGNDGRDTSVHSYYTYDGAGRQLTARTFRSSASAPDQREAVRYNAFGEIIAKGDDDAPGATLQAQYQYDQAGNLVRSNAEGGAWRDYGYNLGGHQVRESHSVYTSAGNVTAVTRQITDRLGRTVQMVLPSHTDTVGQVNYLSQRLDRWGNVLELVDPRGYQTNYQYNDRNQLVKQLQPLVRVVTTSEAGTWQRPELSWSYDELGRLVASRDGNGNLTRYEYDGAGKQTKVIDANGSVTLTAYDALGRARIVQNALGYLTFKDYDRLDRVTAHGDYLPAASGNTRTRKVLESYVLNQNGQRLQSTNAMGQTYKYDYDSRGSLIRSQTPMNVVMEYAYDLGGRRSLERYALEHNNVVDRDGETVRTNEQSWDYDYFGRLIDRNDLSGRDYNYTYDATSGQLTSETNSSNLNRTTTYYANGLVKELKETGATSATYTYAYDQSGNRILEQAQVTDSRGKTYHLRTQIVYDSHNRLQKVVQDDVTTNQRVFELTYDYDAAGNRTHVVARSGYGENTLPITAVDGAPEVIGLPPSRAVRTGVATEFRVRLTDLFRDPEGKLLTVTAQQGSGAALPAWLVYSVDANTGEAVFQASTDSVAGTYQIRLTANDGTSTAGVTFELKVGANTPPAVRSGAPTGYTIKTHRPWAMEFPVADYFLDQDVGDSLTITGAISPGGSNIEIDPQSDASALRLISTAPGAGTYTLTLTATDQTGATRTHTVTLTVAANTAPTVVTPIPNQSATLGRSFLLERGLGTVFQDTHGDALTVTASLSNGLPLPTWLAFTRLDQATPTVRFAGQVPAGIPEGTAYTVRLTAMDPDGASVAVDFVITVYANRAPSIVTVPPTQSGRVSVPYSATFPVTSLFQDPDGEPVSLRLVHPEGAATAWLSLDYDPDTGNITLEGTPAAAHAGSHTVQIEGRDTEGLTTLLTLSFQISTDTAPARNAAVALVDRNLSIGRAFSFTLPDHLFTDAEGDPYGLIAKVIVETSHFEGEGGGKVYELNYSALPAWMTFNPATRTFSGTVPVGTAASAFDVRVTANDGRHSSIGGDRLGVAGNNGDSDFRISLVPFANSAPIYSNGSLPAVTAVHGGAITYNLPAGAFSEPDGDAMTYSAQVQVGSTWVSLGTLGLSINSANGQITGTAANLTQASYTVRIIASDPQGLQGIGTFTLNVTNTPPTASTIPPQTLGRNAAWNFATASFFNDVNQNALTYSASGLPNGLAIHATTGAITGSTAVALGNYSVTVTANDGRGGSVSASFTLTIANSAPVAPSIQNQTAVAGTAWNFLVPSFTDPNGDTLTYSVSGLPAWMGFNAGTLTLSGTPGAVGSWTVTVTATDTAGISASQTFTVSTPNANPTAASIPTQSMARNVAGSISIAGYFGDANGDTLSFSATGLPSGLSISAAGMISGTPTAVLGNYIINVTASDGRGGTVSRTFTLTVANTAPTAPTIPNQTATAGTGWSYQFPLFNDPNNDTLTYSVTGMPSWMSFTAGNRTLSGTPGPVGTWTITVTATDASGASVSQAFTVTTPNVGPTAGTLPAQSLSRNIYGSFSVASAFSDINGDALTFNASGLPSGVTISSTGMVSGTTALAVALGDYTITVTASDGRGGTISRTFTLTIANNAPVAPSIPNQTATAGSGWSYTVPVFTDPNNDGLTYTVSGLPSWMSFAAGSRILSGTPGPVGTWTIVVTATDTAGASVSKSFTVTTPNVAPALNIGIANQSFGRNQAWWLPLPANTFTDVNGDALTYSATGMPPGVGFDPPNRTFYGTPTTLGNYTITVSVSDGRGGTQSTSFVLSVINNPPTYSGNLPNRTAQQNGGINWPLTPSAFLDANSDALSYTLYVERPAYEWTDYTTNPHEPIDRSVPAAWLSASSAGLTIDPNTGTITGTATGIPLPNAGRSAFSYRIKIVASDGSSSVDGIFNLSINAAPVAPAQVPIAARQGRALSATLMSFSDPNGNPLIYSLSGLPAGLSFNPSNRVISGTPTSYGDFNVTYTADDGQGGVTSTTFLLRVTANNIPVAPGIAAQTATTDAAWGLNLPMFSDADNDLMTYSATGLPPGLSFDPATRNITGTPTTAGTYTVTYYANDGIGGVGSTTFTITVNSPPPANVAPVVAIPIPDRYVDYHVNWSYTVPANTFSDANGDTLTYSASGMPSGMTFNATTRTFAMYTPRTGTGMNYTLTVTVSDGRGGFASDQFVLVVDAWEPGGGGNNRMAAQSFTAGSPTAVEAPAAMQAQSSSSAAVNEVHSWYAYDKLNLVSVVNGVVDAQGKVVTANSNKSYGIAYDAVGNEVGRYEWTLVNNVWKTTLRQQTYSLRGELLLTFSEQALDGTGPVPRVMERRSYDDAGRLLERLEYYGPGTSYTWVDRGGDLTKTFVSGWLRFAEVNTYDNDGRLLSQHSKARPSETITRSTNGTNGHAYTFPKWLQHAFENPNISQSTNPDVLVVTSAVSYAEGEKAGYDAAGRVRGYTYAEAGKFTHTYHYERYEGWDSYRESFIKGSSDNELYRLTTSEIKYDAAGRQKEIQEHTEYGSTHDRIRTFTSTGDGMILTRRDGTLNGSTFEQKDAQGNHATGNALGRMNLRNVYANGQQVAGLDEEGKLDVLSRLTGFSNTTAGKTQVLVQAGDSLRTVAQRVYGNGNLWYLIAEANGLSGDPASELVAGTSLTVPETKTSSNDSSTFKPYNPGEITGPTSPSLPYIEPPSGHNCTALVRVLSTVVAIVVRAVVTYFTGNEQLGAMAGAAAGAHSGQVFQLMADGEYDWGRFMRMQMNPAGGNTFDYFDPLGSGAAGKIDYKAIAIAAAAAGATSYVGKIDSEYTPVLQAATSHAANYQFSKWAGYDVSWNNRQFVTDVASAYIATRRFGGSDPSIMKDSSSSTVQPAAVGPIPFSWKQTAMQVLRDTGSNLMRTAIQYGVGKATGAGSHWNWRNTAADAFGNALGNAFATPYMRKFEAAEQARRDATITASVPQVGAASEWPSAVGGYWPGTNSSWALGGFSQRSVSDLAAEPSVVGSISSRYNADYSVSNAVTLDAIEVVGDRNTGRTVSSNFTEWQWRQDYNRWAGVGGNGIPVGASVEQSRAIYHETQLAWHQKDNAEAYARAMQPPKMPSQVGYQLGEGEKLFVRVGGGIVGVLKSFVYDPLVGTLALGRDTILASPQIAALAYATGYDDSSAAAEARMEQRISGAWKFASEDGRFKKVVGSFSGRFTEADALDANGDGMSLFRAAVMRSSAVADAGSIAVGGYGAAKQGVSIAVRGVKGVTESVDDIGRRGDVRDIDLGAPQGGATGFVANTSYGTTLADEVAALQRIGAQRHVSLRDGGIAQLAQRFRFNEHIFDAELNGSKVVGFHHEPTAINSRVVSGTRTPPDPFGVYSGKIEFEASPGNWIQKKGGSTFFPDTWSRTDVMYESIQAFRTRNYPDPMKPSLWSGTTPSGVLVRGYDYPNLTVYPVRRP